MRIIAGKLKGRVLQSFQAPHIRPTTDRVKETVFNKLMGRLSGAKVLDLFSGTGNLGIEAYSRGAHEVCLVENSHKSIQIINKNLSNLNLSDVINVVKCDVFEYLQAQPSIKYDLIFVDPPFTKALAHVLLTNKGLSRICQDEGIIVLESSKQERLDSSYSQYNLWASKNFGDKVLSMWTPKGEENR